MNVAGGVGDEEVDQARMAREGRLHLAGDVHEPLLGGGDLEAHHAFHMGMMPHWAPWEPG